MEQIVIAYRKIRDVFLLLALRRGTPPLACPLAPTNVFSGVSMWIRVSSGPNAKLG